MDLLGTTSLHGADCITRKAYFDQAIALFRELDVRTNLASSLTAPGNIGGVGSMEFIEELAFTLQEGELKRQFMMYAYNLVNSAGQGTEVDFTANSPQVYLPAVARDSTKLHGAANCSRHLDRERTGG